MVHRLFLRSCRERKIRGNTLLVFLFLETGPWGAGHYTGLFHVSASDVAEWTGLRESEVRKAFAELQRKERIVFESARGIVFIRGALARQSPNFRATEKTILGVANHVKWMPRTSRAVREFIKSQRNTPELFRIFEGDSEGDSENTCRPGDLKT